MEINAGWVSAAAAVVGVLATGAGALIHGAFAARDEQIAAARLAQKNLYDKYDAVMGAVQAYKLHVAETYVNQVALQKMLDPIDRRLENIENDLRKQRSS